jgi:hypothetical protein
MTSITILDPTDQSIAQENFHYAKRPKTLNNQKITLLDNSKPNSDTVLHEVARLLGQKYDLTIQYEKKKVHSAPIDADMVRQIKSKSHMVITGVGD